MISFGHITKENTKKHNSNWPKIPDDPYRILMIRGSGSGKIFALINLTKKTRW